MRRLLVVLVIGFLVLGGAVMTPAAAESGSLTDPSGDAPSRIDITGLRVDNDRRWFTMRADVRNLRMSGVFDFQYWRGTTGGLPMQSLIVVVDLAGGETRARFFTCGIEDCTRAPCPRLRSTWRTGQDFVRISAPQRCYPRPRTRPDASPPAAGRFFVSSQIGGGIHRDDHDGQVTLQRD